MLKEIYEEMELEAEDTLEHIKREYNGIRTGRASTSLLDAIKVDYYGSSMPIKQTASVSTPESNLIVIQPWDASITSEIEKAILKSDLGITPQSDGKIIRLVIPPLTEERRIQLAKLVKKIAEESRISIRNVRRDKNDEIKKLLKDKEISEDDAHKGYDKIQEITDEYIKKVDEMMEKKEKEVLES